MGFDWEGILGEDVSEAYDTLVEIQKLIEWDEPNGEGCVASDRITKNGFKVGYMYREEPLNYSTLKPVISEETLFLHYNKHYLSYLEKLNSLKEEDKNESLIDVYMVPLDTNVETLKLASKMRDNNIKVLIEMNKKKIGKCFEYAERENIKYVMIIGENEVNSGLYKIKDMREKQEYTLSEEELIEFINK